MPSQKCAFFLLFILVTSILPEQKFGKVSKEELTMTSIQEDPEADAVYLLDATKIQITKNFNLEMEFHYRIKILTEQGKNKYSDIHVFYRHEDKISHLKAYTILPNGKKIKLDKNQVFTKENERYNEMVFAFPNVEVGSVLEYEYQKWSEYIADLEPWYFQNPEITKICCLEIILPSGFNYNLFSSNHLNYDINPQKTKMVGPGNPNRQPTLFTWKFENVPGLKEEPYVINEMDYRGRLHFLIDSYRDPYGGMYKFYKSWEDIRKNLMEIYDPYISQKGKVKSIANALAVDSLSPKEQLKSIFDYVRSQINTAEYRGIMNDQLLKPEEVLEKKEGSAVEKNLLLIAMLKNSGFKVNPVMISTRDNGLLNERTPSFFQFNHMIVRTKLGMNEFLLDAGDIFCPFGFLPEEDFTNQGFCLLEKGEEFISIPKPKSINMG
ncbi:DUF3857 and transglutaminase domain-containing protein, partial [candidate division KSB1 bacterium]|nr:DUF3857 and transglutaminase domain-containing protein [candidate division KSB1 bacterium]